MKFETRGRPEAIPKVLAKRDKLIAMAKEGASKCELYVEMGITKGCASRWCNENDDRYQPDFVNLIQELTVLSQAWWERLGKDCLNMEKFQATVYNKQMQGRFKDDWAPHSTQTIESTNTNTNKGVDVTQKLLAKIPQELLEQILQEIEQENA